MKRYCIALIVAALSLTSAAQTTWYKFSKEFINSHYPNDSAIGELKAGSVSPARNVHTITCGGNDGELHIGIAGSDITDAGSQTFSGSVDDPGTAFGTVAEPVNLARDTKDAAEALDGQAASFKGYFRVWNEGHDKDSGVASNPAHVMELHPTWEFHGAGQDFADPSSIRPMAGSRGSVFQGYGASKFRPLLTDLTNEQWLHVYEDDAFVYVELERAQNFYQLPVTVNDVHAVTGGVEATVDVFSDANHLNLVLSGLHVIANDGSDIAQSLQNQDDIEFLLGIFSVNLRKASAAAAGHQGPDAAVSAPGALEFFAYGVPPGKAVSTCSKK